MLRVLFFLSAIIFFFAVYFHNIIEFDQDLGRHLLLGKIISETRQVPKTNLFSYTYPDFSFVNSHWLAEVIFYQINNLAGLTGLLLFKTGLLVTAMTLTVWTAYRYSKSLAAAAIALAIFSPVLLERTEIRPEIFSYLFTAIFAYFVCLNKFPKFLYLLFPLLEIIWVNSHIYFIVGPVLLAIALTRNRTKQVIILLVSTVLATLINPNGLTGALYPLQVFNNYGYSIVENQNIFFLREVVFNPNIFYFFLAIAAFSISFLFAGKNSLNVFNIGITALVILPIMAIRSFPFLFLLELPVLAFNLDVFIKGRLAQQGVPLRRALVVAVIVITWFRVLRLVTNEYYESINSSKQFGAEVIESGKGAIDFITAHQLSGPIFNNFDIGSYLDYHLYPTEKVFVDGRPEAYPAAFFQNLYIPMQTSAENFSLVDKKYRFNLIIFAHLDATPWGRQFLTDIIENPDFDLVFRDSYAIVFARKDVFFGLKKSIKNEIFLSPWAQNSGLILF